VKIYAKCFAITRVHKTAVFGLFLPHDAMLKRYNALVVSVCPFLTSRCPELLKRPNIGPRNQRPMDSSFLVPQISAKFYWVHPNRSAKFRRCR